MPQRDSGQHSAGAQQAGLTGPGDTENPHTAQHLADFKPLSRALP